jgi:PAS domain S-box-containing protein
MKNSRLRRTRNWGDSSQEMAKLFAQKDWAKTPLGPPKTWSQSFRLTLDIVLSSSFPMALRWGPDFILIYNDGYKAILGDKHPRALGLPMREAWPEVWHELEPMHRAILSGSSHGIFAEDMLLRLQRHGTEWEDARFTLSYSPVPDTSAPSGIGGVFVTAVETTNRVKTENALRASEERYRTLFQAMSEAYVVHEIVYDGEGNAVDFRAIEANPAFETHTGMPLHLVVGRLASEFAPGGDPAWLELFAGVARSGQPAKLERFSPRPQRWVDLRAFPLGGPRIGAIFNDVTERKRAEAQREAAEARLAAAMQVSEVGVFEYAPETGTVTCSGSCNAIHGFADNVRSRPLADYLARIEPEDAERFRAEIDRALAARDVFQLEYRLPGPDENRRWIASRGAFVTDEAGRPGLAGALFDITARKQTEIEGEAARERTEMLFMEMNHRIKNNLSMVASLLYLQSSANKDPNLRAQLAAARERIMTIAELHTSLYQGDILGQVDFAYYIRRLCAQIKATMPKQPEICLKVETEAVQLSADVAIPLGMVVNELVTNAVKHAFGGMAGDAVIEVSVARSNGHIQLSIADNGQGLPEDWSRIGRGFGSRLVHAFVEQAGGRLRTINTDGSRFEIVIPA